MLGGQQLTIAVRNSQHWEFLLEVPPAMPFGDFIILPNMNSLNSSKQTPCKSD